MKKKNSSLPIRGMFAGIAISIIILLVIQKIFGAKIDSGLLKSSWPIVVAAISLLFLSLGVPALRLLLLLKSLNERLSYFRSYRSTILSLFFSAITPFAAGGQPFQIYDLTKAGINVSHASAAVISQYLISNFSTAFLAVLLLPRYLSYFAKLETTGTIFAFGIAITITVGIFFTFLALSRSLLIKFLNFISHRKFLLTVIGKLAKKDKETIVGVIREKFERYNAGMQSIWSKKPLTLVIDFFLALGYLLINYSIFYVIVVGILMNKGQNFNFSLIDSIAVQTLLSFVVYYIPTPGSSGGFESGMFVMLKGMLPNQSLIIAISIWRFVTYHFLILVGLINFLLSFGQKGQKELN
ncbi:lysylphosphatidylglycerol synthase transmembrane domain-containing protein [Kosmotoga sp.]|jgi:uncharacterized protein (TIRG00374 family)|uniref:lysylphosphatidylglycerol synthase transmembrane domain-containing protein n=1 Tax=Kosmotoga sp. TaxID=1955248 RepID=UPI0024ABD1F1|nr:lysylphosphatidylglycerol synthase transmembrane domain-containing protein [Kosmotoga sp.]MDI3524670.1 glycosyltransferase 2 family protein [Kosmotoga sp.]